MIPEEEKQNQQENPSDFDFEAYQQKGPSKRPEANLKPNRRKRARRISSTFLKNSFLLFLKRTSTQSKGFCPLGSDILESQSKTVSLLQPSVPQVPLFLQPRGCPSLPVEQLLHAIFNILIQGFLWKLLEKGSYLVQM